jgi:hypothetical protein
MVVVGACHTAALLVLRLRVEAAPTRTPASPLTPSPTIVLAEPGQPWPPRSHARSAANGVKLVKTIAQKRVEIATDSVESFTRMLTAKSLQAVPNQRKVRTS